MTNYSNWADKFGFSLTGQTGQEEAYNSVGASAFSLKHDFFYSVDIWTGAGATGVKLTLNTDFTLVEGTSDLANSLNAKSGIVTTVKTGVTIINATYQVGDLFVTPLVSADIVDNSDINLAVTKTDTSTNLAALNVVLESGETAHESDTGLSKIGDGITAYNLLSYTKVNLPIGYIYTQYPNKGTPSALGLAGTWTNISSTFAGNFFRAEGGNASAFESGVQSDAMQNHWIQLLVDGSGAVGGAQYTTGSRRTPLTATDREGTIHENLDSSAGSPRLSSETRSINETIRIWERTA
jgi:hypothetical protein